MVFVYFGALFGQGTSLKSEKNDSFKIDPKCAYPVPNHVKCCWNNISHDLGTFRCILDGFSKNRFFSISDPDLVFDVF